VNIPQEEEETCDKGWVSLCKSLGLCFSVIENSFMLLMTNKMIFLTAVPSPKVKTHNILWIILNFTMET